MEHQVRRYKIVEGRMSEFLEAWRAGVVPLRESFGFVVEGAWIIPETSEFVWVLGHDGPEGLAAADRAYYDSGERASLRPDPRQFIETVSESGATRVL